MYLLRGFLVWLLIIFAESVHGALRQAFLAPLVGDFPARRIAFFTGLLLIFLITFYFIRWIAAHSVKSLFLIGLIWLILTVIFEFGLGFFVLNYSWERMTEDYDVSRGGLMGFGLLFLLFAPYLAAILRKKKGNEKMKFIKQTLVLFLLSNVFLLTTNGQEEKPIRIETDLVTINVAVKNAKGKYIADLRQTNFEIFDNGATQEITDFSPQDSPVSFGIVYDMHPTTDERTKTVLEALRRFTKELRQGDDIFFLAFNERGSLSADFVPPFEQVTKHFSPDSHRAAPNSLYDAVYLSADKIRPRRNEKKIILIISDGADHNSRHNYQELRNRLKSFDVQIYAVMLDENADGRWVYSDLTGKTKSPTKTAGDVNELDRAAINEMTMKSGGTAYSSALDSEWRLYDIAREISFEVRQHYTLGFYPTAKDGKWHQLTVRLRPESKSNKEVVLTYRQGYQSPSSNRQ